MFTEGGRANERLSRPFATEGERPPSKVGGVSLEFSVLKGDLRNNEESNGRDDGT